MGRFIDYPLSGIGGYLHTTPSDVVFMAECLSCGLQRELSHEELGRHLRGLEILPELAARLRCSGCREKNAKLMTGYYAEGDP